jgi:hypothetical protein
MAPLQRLIDKLARRSADIQYGKAFLIGIARFDIFDPAYKIASATTCQIRVTFHCIWAIEILLVRI